MASLSGSLAGSLSGALGGSLSGAGATPDTTAPTILSATLAGNGLGFALLGSENLSIVGTVNDSAFWSQLVFTVQGLGIDLPITAAAIAGATVSTTNPILPRNVVATLAYTKGADPDYWLKDSATPPNYVDSFSGLTCTTSGGPVDSTAPTITYVYIGEDGDDITIYFDSWMNFENDPTFSGLSLGGTGASFGALLGRSNQYPFDDRAWVKFSLSPIAYSSETVTLSGSGVTFEDLAGNDLPNFINMAVDNQSTAVRPTVTAFLANPGSSNVEAIFSEAMDTSSTPNIGAWTFEGTVATAVSYVGWSDSTHLVINTSVPIVGGLGETGNYTPSGAPLKTSDNRQVAAFEDVEIEAD